MAVGYVASHGNPAATGGHGQLRAASEGLAKDICEYAAPSLRRRGIMGGLSAVSKKRNARGALAVQRRYTLALAGDRYEGQINVEAIEMSGGARVLPHSSTPRVAVNCVDGSPAEPEGSARKRDHVRVRCGKAPRASCLPGPRNSGVSDRSVRVDAEIHLPSLYPEGLLGGGASLAGRGGNGFQVLHGRP